MSSTIPLPEQPSRLTSILTNKLNLSAIGVVAVFVACVAYIMTAVLDVGIPLISSAKTIEVDLPSTGGLYVGAPVSYRGVNVGRITNITFTTTGVQAEARVDPGNDLPIATKVMVKSLSPVGEQYLDFEPFTNHGPYLQDGSTVVGTGSSVPETLASTVISVNKLLNQVNAQQLQTILDESNKALVGTSGELGQLADQGSALVRDLNQHWSNFDHVVTNGDILLKIGDQYGSQIISAAQDFRSFAAWLKGYTPTLVTTLENAPSEMSQLQAVLADARLTLPTFVGLGAQVTSLIASYDPHLQALLAGFPVAVNALASMSYANGSAHGGIIGQQNHLCMYSTAQLPPNQVSHRPLQTQGHCPGSYQWLQRGAAHAPGPVR